VSRKLFVGGKAKKCSSSVLIFIPALDQAIYALKENQPGASAIPAETCSRFSELSTPSFKGIMDFFLVIKGVLNFTFLFHN